jgi:DNA-binding response OmpR family regulator
MLKKLLIAEDEDVLREMLSDFLIDAGFDVVQAENGEVAWDLWNQIKCDLLITDINMPKLNGTDLLKKIKAVDNNFPVIVCTGVTVDDAKETALSNGADGFFPKPCSMREIISLISKLLNISE